MKELYPEPSKKCLDNMTVINCENLSKKYDDVDNRWKVFTLWMTANDICNKCDETLSDKKLNKWLDRTDTLLQNVTSTMKKVYINLYL